MKRYDVKTIIRLLLDRNGWHQETLAEKAGVSKTTISEILSGKKSPKYVTVEKIAHAFGMEVVELLSYRPDRDTTDIDHLSSGDNKHLLEWVKNPDNLPYLKFAYEISRNFSVTALKKIKIVLDMGQNQGMGV